MQIDICAAVAPQKEQRGASGQGAKATITQNFRKDYLLNSLEFDEKRWSNDLEETKKLFWTFSHQS